MGVTYLWDTNIAIYYLNRLFPFPAEKFIDEALKKSPPCISAITEIELLCWSPASERYTGLIQSFIADSMIIELEQAIKLKAAEIRKVHKLKLPDAIIAATAVVYDFVLLTRDVDAFRNIKNLRIYDPWNQIS